MKQRRQTELPNWTPALHEDEEIDTSDKEDSDSDSEPDIDELESQDAAAAGMGNAASAFDRDNLSVANDALPQPSCNSSPPRELPEQRKLGEPSREELKKSTSSWRDTGSPENSPTRQSSPDEHDSPAPPAPNAAFQTPPPQNAHPDAHSESPRPFPLSPPRPSQALDVPTLFLPSPEASNESDWDDMMPTVEEMLSMTQPVYRASTLSPDNKKTPESMTEMDEGPMAAEPVNVPPRPKPRPSPAKRKKVDAPRVPQSPLKELKVEEAEPERVYIEILESSASENEESQYSMTAKPKSKTQRTQPSLSKRTRKPKRKRSLSPVASASTSEKSLQRQTAAPPKPPRKRAKAESYKKHAVHWHLDGSVLIQVEDTRFKLPRSVLVYHSEWFQHTFERGEDAPERAPELVDNLPLYYLDGLGVSADDFAVLLDAINDAITYVRADPPFATIASILRASSALTFTKFESYATDYLTTMWSADLADLSTTSTPYAIETIALARHLALFPVLKRALYELVRLERFDRQKPLPGEPRNRAPGLHPRDKDALIDARVQLTRVWTAEAADPEEFPPCTVQPLPPLPDANAGNVPAPAPQPCVATDRVLSQQAHTNLVKTTGIFRTYQYDVVCGLRALAEAPWGEQGFCEACVELKRERWMTERERVWEALDEWFGI